MRHIQTAADIWRAYFAYKQAETGSQGAADWAAKNPHQAALHSWALKAYTSGEGKR